MHPLIENALLDVYDAAIELDETIRDLSLETYLEHRPARRIVERLLEIIGESVSLSPGVASWNEPTGTEAETDDGGRPRRACFVGRPPELRPSKNSVESGMQSANSRQLAARL